VAAAREDHDALAVLNVSLHDVLPLREASLVGMRTLEDLLLGLWPLLEEVLRRLGPFTMCADRGRRSAPAVTPSMSSLCSAFLV